MFISFVQYPIGNLKDLLLFVNLCLERLEDIASRLLKGEYYLIISHRKIKILDNFPLILAVGIINHNIK
ncbi:hypothetical protein AGMMS49936_07680 [Endomicrobiia bacterium]|nr:hypothetical protein AGMMS49936_07680 [Endomicrobiia bacterium]